VRTQLQPRDRWLFIGDSITDCGRKRPIGEGPNEAALGSGYVSLVASALTATYPDYGIHVLNMGVAGDTVRDLKVRWATDVLKLRPDWLAILIGINDVWQQCDNVWDAGSAISRDEYSDTLADLIRQAEPGLRGLILMTPYVLEPDRAEPMRALMDEFGAATRQIAAGRGAILVDTQAAFDQILRWLPPERLAPDRVHVNQTGHMVIARALLRQIGHDWARRPASANTGG
jgi:lysophospholipase L1-like esterase